MRVLHITAIGKTARLFLAEHFRRLRAEGFEVGLVCREDEDAQAVAAETQIPFYPIPIRQNISPWSDLRSVISLWRIFLRIQPMIVHAHMSKAGLLGMLAAWWADVPIRIYHNHGMAFLSQCGLKRCLLRSIEWLSCTLATEVLYCGPSTRTEAVRAGVCRPDKAKVLGPGTICGIDVKKFDPVCRRERGRELRRNAGIPDEAQIVGFVGRLVPHKGVETILQAWRLVSESARSRVWLCFFGTHDDPKLQQLVESAASEESLHVRMLGFSEEMPAWYSVMTLLVQASWHEGFPYSILEAGCCGVPTVATNVSGTRDAVRDGRTGLLVPVHNPQDLTTAIERLLTDDSLQKRLGIAARDRILHQFDQESICPLLTREYRRILQKYSYTRIG